MKKVIDGDTMRCLETFDVKDTDNVIAKYEALGIYDDVSLDTDGDIILYRETD